ncbi:MAG TPA: PAS domain-containing sensor histidine kinase [Gemmatimonadaceae bacterium]|nr:PAS domain-containing sensor histidine kinase [Gemmatimonadaceae bacterium]
MTAAEFSTTDVYRLLVDSVQDYAIFALDATGHIQTWNKGARRLKGYTSEEIIGKHFSIFYPREDVAAHKPERELEIATRTGQYEEEGWRVRKDGTRFWASVLITAMRDNSGELVGFAKVTRDLSARREAQQREIEGARQNAELTARAEEERALRRLTQQISGATRIPEIMHQIAQGALAVSEAGGAYVEQAIDTSNVEIVAVAGEATPSQGARVPYPGSLTEEIIKQREPVFLMRMEGLGAAMAPYLDESCHGCSVFVVPLFGGPAVLGALVLLRRPNEQAFEPDIVNRVRTLGDLASIALQRLVALDESERRAAEAEAAVRSRDEVLSVVSHDLRNPVTAVVMSASLLEDADIALTAEQRRKQVEIIKRSAQRMNRLIQDLVDVARIEGGRFAISCRDEDPGSLAAEACEAFRPLADEKSIALECDIQPNLPTVNADRDRMVQALSNFLNNAVKFTPAGGRIRLSASREAPTEIRFAIADTGTGIASEERPHVFNRFWQARRTAHLGSGLGLAIAKGIAEAHGGRVSVESTPGHGSTFSLYLPSDAHCASD